MKIEAMENFCLGSGLGAGEGNWSEYLLVAHPSKEVETQVWEERKHFAERYSLPSLQTGRVLLKKNVHVRLAKFTAKEAMEPTLIRWMHRIIGSQKKSKIQFQRFAGLANHTLCLPVIDREPFQQLAKAMEVVNQWVKTYDCPEVHWTARPYLSIAKKIPNDLYQQIAPIYSQKMFAANFELTELMLLRRQNPLGPCKEIAVFALQP